MKRTTLQIRVSEELKKQLTDLAESKGLKMSEYLRYIIMEKTQQAEAK